MHINIRFHWCDWFKKKTIFQNSLQSWFKWFLMRCFKRPVLLKIILFHVASYAIYVLFMLFIFYDSLYYIINWRYSIEKDGNFKLVCNTRATWCNYIPFFQMVRCVYDYLARVNPTETLKTNKYFSLKLSIQNLSTISNWNLKIH